MRPKQIVLELIIVMLIASLASAQNSLEKKVSLSDKAGYLCGFGQLVDPETELKNTLLYHPEIIGSLQKPSKVTIEVGDTLEFYTVNFINNSREKISAVCRHKSSKTYIFVGLNEWSSEKVVQQDVENFHQAFELSTPPNSVDPNQGIRSIEETTFGRTPNKSGDGYVYILIHDIIDDYSEGNSTSFIAGYFSPTDQSNVATSNKKDIIYVDCNPANPSGSYVLAVVAHEFQHLIHYGFDGNETAWVNEGASEYAEVLCGYSLRDPSRYLRNPDRSLTRFQYQSTNSLLDYAKVALWTYYLAEKFGPSLIGNIVKNPSNSVEGVRNALLQQGISLTFEEIFANFVVANYADNPAIGGDGFYGYTKINLPTLPKISSTHRVYPVDEKQNSLSPYSAAYFRFTAPDSTAILRIDASASSTISPQIYMNGDQDSVMQISLETDNSGGMFSLKEIGKSASEVVLVPTSLNTGSFYTYYVTSEIEDLAPPVIISGPNESLPSGNSISIFWETDELSTSIVEYGKTVNYSSTHTDTNLVSFHQVNLDNLIPNTTYHYRVGSVDNKGNGPVYSIDFTFTTSSIAANQIVTVKQTHSFGYIGRSLVKDSNNILHLLYHELVDNRRFVYHMLSADDGETWSEPIQVDDSNFYGGMPSIAVDASDNLHAAWHAQEFESSKFNIYYSRSENGGLTWSSPVQISKTFTADDQLYAAVAVDTANNPHVVWNTVASTDGNIGDVYYNYSPDGGKTWGTDRMISTSTDHRCFVPTIDFTRSGKAYVFYTDGNFDQNTLKGYFVSSDDYQQWSTAQAVTTSGVLYSTFVSFVIDSQDQIHLVYSDNFTPGDIRIMYTRFNNRSWEPPVPIARSITGGFVSYPSIAVDEDQAIYVAYRDDMTGGQLGKLVHDVPVQDGRTLSKTMDPSDRGETFLTINRKGNWIPATNISNDNVNSEYPELPENLENGLVDLIWMSEVSSSSNRINFIHLDTRSAPNLTPPQISRVYPEDGQTDVPYFKQLLKIDVEFNQRIETDSLIPQNVMIKNSTNETIVGELSYQESLRQMEFVPADDLPADDLITVTITTGLTNVSGVGLDGNKNGIAEGSPIDDFSWSFRTQPLDTLPPEFTIGVLQNPVLTKYVDLLLIASEQLAEIPSLSIENKHVPLILNNAEANVYKGDYKLEQSGQFQIKATGADWGGNIGSATRLFSAQLMKVEQGGVINSPDGNLSILIPAAAVEEDVFFTIVEKTGDTADRSQVYSVGPAGLTLDQTATIEFRLPDQSRRFQLERKNRDGVWSPVKAEQTGSRLTAKITGLGEFRLKENGDFIPQKFVLRQNYPNPFSLKEKKTTLTYELPQKETVQVVIYNVLGKKIITLLHSEQEPGIYQLHWNGKDEQNRRVASGIYFYQLKTQSRLFTKKMLILQ